MPKFQRAAAQGASKQVSSELWAPGCGTMTAADDSSLLLLQQCPLNSSAIRFRWGKHVSMTLSDVDIRHDADLLLACCTGCTTSCVRERVWLALLCVCSQARRLSWKNQSGLLPEFRSAQQDTAAAAPGVRSCVPSSHACRCLEISSGAGSLGRPIPLRNCVCESKIA